MSDHRTETQREANAIDMELYRLLVKTERLYGDPRGNRAQREHTSEAMHGIRAARARIRLLMHREDRDRT